MKNTHEKTAENRHVLDYEGISGNLDAIALLLQSMAVSIRSGEMVETEKAIYLLSSMVLDESKNTKALFDLAHASLKVIDEVSKLEVTQTKAA